MTDPIVSSEWLKENLDAPDLIILDASSKNNKAGLTTEFENIQIAGARYFDIKNNFSDKSSKYPNMLLSSEQFEIECKNLGINDSSRIVVYDNLGIYTSPRVWWMFKTMGHDKIAVLNGGLPDWINKGYRTEQSKKSEFDPGNFESNFRAEKVKDFDFIKKNLKSQTALVLDARSANRFNGIAPEPRKGLRSGHIPKSVNVPFQNVLMNGKYKSKNELSILFANLKVDEKPLIFSCGSGITACIILIACELILENEKSVYDGSWTEWAQLENY